MTLDQYGYCVEGQLGDIGLENLTTGILGPDYFSPVYILQMPRVNAL